MTGGTSVERPDRLRRKFIKGWCAHGAGLAEPGCGAGVGCGFKEASGRVAGQAISASVPGKRLCWGCLLVAIEEPRIFGVCTQPFFGSTMPTCRFLPHRLHEGLLCSDSRKLLCVTRIEQLRRAGVHDFTSYFFGSDCCRTFAFDADLNARSKGCADEGCGTTCK